MKRVVVCLVVGSYFLACLAEPAAGQSGQSVESEPVETVRTANGLPSVGAVRSAGRAGADELISCADQAMYRAKQLARSRA